MDKTKILYFMAMIIGKFDKTQIFPLILIILDVGAGIMYIPQGDFRKVIYWLAAAILNICVTF